jgi:hypothetical protein
MRLYDLNTIDDNLILRLQPNACPAGQRTVRAINQGAGPVDLHLVTVVVFLISFHGDNRKVCVILQIGFDSMLINMKFLSKLFHGYLQGYLK